MWCNKQINTCFACSLTTSTHKILNRRVKASFCWRETCLHSSCWKSSAAHNTNSNVLAQELKLNCSCRCIRGHTGKGSCIVPLCASVPVQLCRSSNVHLLKLWISHITSLVYTSHAETPCITGQAGKRGGGGRCPRGGPLDTQN